MNGTPGVSSGSGLSEHLPLYKVLSSACEHLSVNFVKDTCKSMVWIVVHTGSHDKI